MTKTDSASIPFKNEEFDVILCNQGLEHRGDDREAVAEFRRMRTPSCGRRFQGAERRKR